MNSQHAVIHTNISLLKALTPAVAVLTGNVVAQDGLLIIEQSFFQFHGQTPAQFVAANFHRRHSTYHLAADGIVLVVILHQVAVEICNVLFHGLINSIGLQNPGVQHFIDVELNEMLELKQKYGTVAIANLGGHSEEEYVEGAALLSESAVDIVELNISCPNVKVGGMAYGVKAEAAGEVVRMVRAACKKPLMVKLSPQAENIPEMCKAVEAAGADAISLTNTFQACAIDLEKRKPVFNNIFAGLSGPAVRPIALRMVWQAVGAVNIPVVGLGGIATGRDALEFIMAGATAVQVGAANFANPRAMETIADEMAQWMDAHGVKTLEEIRGCARNAE